eukprot:CAMPEP_0182419884 /NCGR_PEP_ID=MMETSP1167-20130531/4229_1 /TAXON_ID=2988 /ORGANISM="Mallomonas Sp, Strain CCMP3275" /LENGTH=562 /DNA_ID=CAMNT_0024595025 /DNA_START=86 /DNA_END=1774 /DNA_ORIENTATION=+
MAQVAKLDMITAVRNYMDKIMTDQMIGGMKVLLLDPLTTQVASMVYSQTQIMEQEVYLVEPLGKRNEAIPNLKAAVFVQPTDENIELLILELHEPRFSEYHIFFSNILPQDLLSKLAKADEHEVVKQVQEYYADFLAVNGDFFQLGIDKSMMLSTTAARTMESNSIFERNVQGVLSGLLALKRRPSHIRYASHSEVARRIAAEVIAQIERDDVFDFRRQEGPLLLLLDRRDDPITPLLTQWTYQAMVHELLGLNNNRVSLAGAPGIRKDLEEVVLSITSDKFFATNRFANFGDLGTAVKQMLDEYQSRAKMNENIQSVEDMQHFMERYPAFRSQSLNVSKHVALMGELARLVDKCMLLEVSKLEQEISCSSDHSTHKAELFEIFANPKIHVGDKLRLALLYVIRYEKENEIKEIKTALSMLPGLSSERIELVDAILSYAGEHKRAPGLFGSGVMSLLQRTVKSAISGVENVYTQHQPVLWSILESIAKGKLKDSHYPVAWGSVTRPQEVMVFIVGGATYEEATKVAEFNTANPTMRVILGGSCVHNSQSFMGELEENYKSVL